MGPKAGSDTVGKFWEKKKKIGSRIGTNPTPEYRDKDGNNPSLRHLTFMYYSVLPGCCSSDIITGEDFFRWDCRTLPSPVNFLHGHMSILPYYGHQHHHWSSNIYVLLIFTDHGISIRPVG